MCSDSGRGPHRALFSPLMLRGLWCKWGGQTGAKIWSPLSAPMKDENDEIKNQSENFYPHWSQFLCVILGQSRRLSVCDAAVAQSANQRHTTPQPAGFTTNFLKNKVKKSSQTLQLMLHDPTKKFVLIKHDNINCFNLFGKFLNIQKMTEANIQAIIFWQPYCV